MNHGGLSVRQLLHKKNQPKALKCKETYISGSPSSKFSTSFAAHRATQSASHASLKSFSDLSQGANMKLMRRNQILHIRKRVPRRYRSVEEREFFWVSLHTDSEAVARLKAPIIWAEMIEAWEAKLAGDTSDADGRITAAKNLAAKRGYRYLPVASVAQLPMTELLDRAERIVTPSGKVDLIEADALLGLLGEPEVTVTKALEQYWTIARAKTLG